VDALRVIAEHMKIPNEDLQHHGIPWSDLAQLLTTKGEVKAHLFAASQFQILCADPADLAFPSNGSLSSGHSCGHASRRSWVAALIPWKTVISRLLP
jgi:hypothetical protein